MHSVLKIIRVILLFYIRVQCLLTEYPGSQTQFMVETSFNNVNSSDCYRLLDIPLSSNTYTYLFKTKKRPISHHLKVAF